MIDSDFSAIEVPIEGPCCKGTRPLNGKRQVDQWRRQSHACASVDLRQSSAEINIAWRDLFECWFVWLVRIGFGDEKSSKGYPKNNISTSMSNLEKLSRWLMVGFLDS